jgi:hypothetical protein
MSESPDEVVRQFTYKLNAMESASQATNPADHDYAGKRAAVLTFVRNLAEKVIRDAAPAATGEPPQLAVTADHDVFDWVEQQAATGEPSDEAAEAFLAAHSLDAPGSEAGIRRYPQPERIAYVRKWLRAAYAVDFPAVRPAAARGEPSEDWRPIAREHLHAIDTAITAYRDAVLDPSASIIAARAIIHERLMDLCDALSAVPRSSGAQAEPGINIDDVYAALHPLARTRTSRENVTDTLCALATLRAASPTRDERPETTNDTR